MTVEEWRQLADWMRVCFKGDLTPGREAACFRFVGPYPKDVVETAIDRLMLEGQEFMPVPGELMKALQAPVPSWDQVWSIIRPVLTQASRYGEEGCITRIREQAGDLIAGWVATYGAIRLSREPVDDGENGPLMYRLAQSWKDATATFAQRQITSAVVDRLSGGGQPLLASA